MNSSRRSGKATIINNAKKYLDLGTTTGLMQIQADNITSGYKHKALKYLTDLMNVQLTILMKQKLIMFKK